MAGFGIRELNVYWYWDKMFKEWMIFILGINIIHSDLFFYITYKGVEEIYLIVMWII